MSRRDENKAATAGKVVGAARELFEAVGYEAVTMRDVAKRAGVSTGAIFTSFEGKDALFIAAMGRKPPNPVHLFDLLSRILRGEIDPVEIGHARNDLLGQAH